MDAGSGLLRHIEGHGKGDVIERAQRVIGGRGQLGRKCCNRGGGRDHVVKGIACLDGGHTGGVELAHGREHFCAAEVGHTVSPGADIGQHQGAALLGQRCQVQVGAHAPGMVHAVQHRPRQERLHGRDDGTGPFKQLRCAQHGGLHLGVHRQTAAGIQ